MVVSSVAYMMLSASDRALQQPNPNRDPGCPTLTLTLTLTPHPPLPLPLTPPLPPHPKVTVSGSSFADSSPLVMAVSSAELQP